MPAVITISGVDIDVDGKTPPGCRRVKAGKKKGCTQLLCKTGLGATGFTFIKGSRRCTRRR